MGIMTGSAVSILYRWMGMFFCNHLVANTAYFFFFLDEGIGMVIATMTPFTISASYRCVNIFFFEKLIVTTRCSTVVCSDTDRVAFKKANTKKKQDKKKKYLTVSSHSYVNQKVVGLLQDKLQ